MSNALVIGGGRGIGLALTTALLSEEQTSSVTVTTRSESSGQSAESLASKKLHTARLDVTDDDAIAAFADRIGQDLPVPDLVIHAAGILHEGELQPEKSLRQCKRESLQRVFEVNSIGPLMVARALIPKMSRTHAGHYAFLSAMVGSISDNRLGGWYAYRASKAALNQFVRTMAIECRRTHSGLCLTAIHPGTTDTGLSRPFQSNVKPGKLYTPEQSAGRIIDVVRSGSPEDSGRFVNWDGNPIAW